MSPGSPLTRADPNIQGSIPFTPATLLFVSIL